ncbi:hypothetical protein QZH41_009865 [Actinostola sp. cb2023]|nr:hypothetical protein QZH41_009865 [Actinostola sp. cb2023]
MPHGGGNESRASYGRPTLKMRSVLCRRRPQIQRMRPVPAAKIITEGSNHMAYQDETSHIVLFLHKPCRRKVMSSCDREKKRFERNVIVNQAEYL